METYELRYFLGVARHQNIHRASEELRVSPGSLSKAIARLEAEYQVKLFSREGRNIRITDYGRVLQRRGSELLHAEESLRLELMGADGVVHVVIAGPEVLLSRPARRVVEQIEKKHPKATFEFHSMPEAEALVRITRGEAHLALVTQDAPAGAASRAFEECAFRTCVGKGHLLHSAAKAGKTVPVEEVLKHSFVSPSLPLFGQLGLKQSLDGWRDDRFPRRVTYLTSSLRTLEELVTSGKAIAYLPNYLLEANSGLVALKISGCPYTCSQKIRLVTRDTKSLGWINLLF